MLFSSTLLFGFIALLFLIIPIMIGVYVYRDAGRRRMNAGLWTLIAVLAPALIGFIIYLLIRSDHSPLTCPNCHTQVNEEFNSCPQCGTSLKNKCPNCDYSLESSWQKCPRCGEPVPESLKVVLPQKSKDKGLAGILIAVILIPILIVALLAISLVSYRSGHPTSVASVDGMRIEDFTDNKAVVDWLKYCDDLGKGIYVLEYRHPQDDSNGMKRSSYIVYRSGLTKNVNVAASGGLQGFKESFKIEYTDADTEGGTDYHIYQVAYATTEEIKLEVYVNGEPVDYQLTKSNDPLLFIDPVYWRNDAANLYKRRLDYLGDSAGVTRLIEETGLTHLGEYTIELKTDQKPLGLHIKYSSSIDKFEAYDFTTDATELLGLIKNLDYVEISGATNTYKLTADEASAALGYDVKEFGKSADKLDAYLEALYAESEGYID